MKIDSCPCCSSSELAQMYSIDRIPVHSCILSDSAEAACSIPTGALNLTLCKSCGFVFNSEYDELLQDYNPAYEEQQTFSKTFNAFQTELISRLVDTYKLRGKTALEIGCGKGDFLSQLVLQGEMEGIGIDPSASWERLSEDSRDRIRIVQEHFGPRHLQTGCDFLCCRHTLEHIGDTKKFLTLVEQACKQHPKLPVFFEVPDALRVFREGAFWDVYYEHCSYFTPGSLARFFRACGFAPDKLLLEYDKQYLTIEGSFKNSTLNTFDIEESLERTVDEALKFSNTVKRQIDAWQKKLKQLSAKDSQIAIWGSGSKCVAFLFSLGMAEKIDRIIDINPYRHGKYAPGLRTKIEGPESLRDTNLDLLIIMNPIYQAEIEADLARLNCSVSSIEALG